VCSGFREQQADEALRPLVITLAELVMSERAGRFNTIEGQFVVVDDPDRLFEQIEISLEAASIDTKVESRDEDLRHERFFDVDKFPVLTFHGTESTRTGEQLWHHRRPSRQYQDRLQRGCSRCSTEFELTTELLQESGPGGGLDIDIRVDTEAVLEPATS
jgi:hypothetical protein